MKSFFASLLTQLPNSQHQELITPEKVENNLEIIKYPKPPESVNDNSVNTEKTVNATSECDTSLGKRPNIDNITENGDTQMNEMRTDNV